MKSYLSRTVSCGGCLLATGLAVMAGPLQRADVPAEPAWVLHLDCDSLRSTTIGQYILNEMEKPEAKAKLAAFQAMFSLDLRSQLHAITLYSVSLAPEDGVLLVNADFDADRLVTLAKGAQDYQSTPYKAHVIHNWIDDKKKAKDGVKPRVYAAIQGHLVIFGQREARVGDALDVLDRAKPNLAGSQTFADMGSSGGASFFQAAARKLDLPSADPHAAMFRLSQQVRFQLGEEQGQVKASLSLDAKDEEIAGHITSIAQGLVALMKLQTEKPDAVKLAEAIAIKQDGATVVARASLPADDVVSMMKAGAARKAAKKTQAH